ncbi:NAD-dependent epimerase/dehydratase family protein [Longimicrobium sp.]|uniref:NAD-dependent epimerase/dehydratase family protein n=1 Tax=Longimicrobium sp. TaxID=2029185 RepID=UPI003B3A0554
MTDTAAPSAGLASALLLGATGLVGGHVLDLLLGDPAYGRVVVLGRRAVDRQHPKLQQHVADLGRLDEHAALFAVDDVFCCLGTTIRAAGSQDAFRRVDHDYVVGSARVAAAAGARRYLLVTAAGASPTSRFFYSRVKGDAEAGVRAQPFEGIVILRPSLILGPREDRRPSEALFQRVAPAVAWMLVGPLRRARAVDARNVARAMVRLAKERTRGIRVVESEEIPGMGGA